MSTYDLEDASHNIKVLSAETLAKLFEFNPNLTPWTGYLCILSVSIRILAYVSHSFIVWS